MFEYLSFSRRKFISHKEPISSLVRVSFDQLDVVKDHQYPFSFSNITNGMVSFLFYFGKLTKKESNMFY